MALICGDDGSTGQEVLGQINENTDNIVANTSSIVVNSENITDLENLNDYVSVTEEDILTVGDVYEEIATISATLSSGKYVLSWSADYTFDSTSQSAFIKITVNGLDTEYHIEPKDSTDRQPVSYYYPLNHTVTGVFTVVMEMRKESVANTLNVHKASIMMDKKDEL